MQTTPKVEREERKLEKLRARFTELNIISDSITPEMLQVSAQIRETETIIRAKAGK